MVEGIVVISVMIGFLGLIMGAKKAYEAKLYRQQGTRATALYSASHACEKSENGYTGETGGGGEAGGGEGGDITSPPKGTDSGPGGGAASTTTKWNSVAATDSESPEWIWIADQNAGGGGSSTINLQKSSKTTNVKANSFCVCNEKKYDNQLTAWLSFGASLIKSGGGFPW